ncbi:MAG: ABC transporter substrate-binding protein [Clostridiales bacterium]|nr:ABC transporter substrate-binding protein [Clostridiales bacterium]
MKKGSKIFLLVLNLTVFLLLFFACSKKNFKQKEIKIGILMPLSGKNAQFGIAPKNGAKLFVDEYNKNNEFTGIKIKLVIYNDESEIDKSIIGFNSLFDSGVCAIITGAESVTSLATAPVAHDCEMPLILTTASAEAITYDSKSDIFNDNVFRMGFIDSYQGEKMANFANEHLNVKRAASFYCLEDDYSMGLKEAFEKKCKQLNIEMISQDSFSINATDFQSQLAKILAKKPDVLFIPAYYDKVALIAPQAIKIGIDCPLLGCDGWGTVTKLISNSSFLENSYYCSAFSVEDDEEIARYFSESYRKKMNEEANMFSASGYDAAKVLVNAIEKSIFMGFLPENNEFRKVLIDTLKKTDLKCVTGNIVFDEHNNPKKEAVIIKITGGKERFWGRY